MEDTNLDENVATIALLNPVVIYFIPSNALTSTCYFFKWNGKLNLWLRSLAIQKNKYKYVRIFIRTGKLFSHSYLEIRNENSNHKITPKCIKITFNFGLNTVSRSWTPFFSTWKLPLWRKFAAYAPCGGTWGPRISPNWTTSSSAFVLWSARHPRSRPPSTQYLALVCNINNKFHTNVDLCCPDPRA